MVYQTKKNLDSYKQKVSHLQALYHLARGDRSVSKEELTYIRIVAEHLGVPVDVLEKFEGEPELTLPNREYKVYGLFHRLVIVVMIDNELNEQERRYCFNLGIKMGLHPNAIGEIIDLVQRNGATKTQPKEIMDIFRKYMS